MDVEIRPWRPGDEAAILGLFRAVFGREMSPAYWRWRFHDHPAGGPLVMLAWAGETLAAHYAASRATLAIEGEAVPAALSMTTMTHPGWRGRGLLEATARALYAALAAEGCAATLGFPNQMVHAARLTKLGWIDVCDVATMTADLTRPPVADPAVIAADAIDARFDRLATRLARDTPVGFARDAATLAWRIDANPAQRYTRLLLPEGGGIAGYALLKPFGAEAMDLVELRAADAAATRALLAAAQARAAAAGARRLHCWRLPGEPDRALFERAGFAAGAPVTYFGGCALARPVALINDPRRWRLAMLDSDLY